MIADLLKSHQKRQNHPAPVDSFLSRFELARQFLHTVLVQRRLLSRKLAIRFHFGLLGQIADDGFVGFQPPQYVWPYKFAKRCVGIVSPFRKFFGESFDFTRRPEQTWVCEVKDRPKIAQAVFNGRTCQYDPLSCLKLFYCAGLFRDRILNGLSFVEDSQIPGYLDEVRRAHQRSIAGDHQIDTLKGLQIQPSKFTSRHRGRMSDHRVDTWRKPLEFDCPVREQRRGSDYKTGPTQIPGVSKYKYLRDHLHRFAEAHVIGKTGAETQRGQ